VARTLRYTDEAITDLNAVRRWQTQPGSGAAAARRLRALRAAIRRLKRDPCIHPAGDHPGVRELPGEGGYRVMYVLEPDTWRSETSGNVLVLRVFGPGQSREAL